MCGDMCTQIESSGCVQAVVLQWWQYFGGGSGAGAGFAF